MKGVQCGMLKLMRKIFVNKELPLYKFSSFFSPVGGAPPLFSGNNRPEKQFERLIITLFWNKKERPLRESIKSIHFGKFEFYSYAQKVTTLFN